MIWTSGCNRLRASSLEWTTRARSLARRNDRRSCGRSGRACSSPGNVRRSDLAEQLLDRQQSLRVRHLQQTEFEMEALLLLVSQFAVGAQHDLQMAREIFLAEQFRDTLYALALF